MLLHLIETLASAISASMEHIVKALITLKVRNVHISAEDVEIVHLATMKASMKCTLVIVSRVIMGMVVVYLTAPVNATGTDNVLTLRRALVSEDLKE